MTKLTLGIYDIAVDFVKITIKSEETRLVAGDT